METIEKTKTKLEWALELVRRGAGIVPLHASLPDGSCTCRKGKECRGAGKHPIHNAWQLNTLKSEAAVLAWHDRNPDANYGANLAGIGFIVDVDEKDGKNGINNLLAHINTFRKSEGKEPIDLAYLKRVTFTVESPSGGLHFYFLHGQPVGNPDCGIEGIDIRGVGGQCVAPKSVVYKLNEDFEVAPVPYKVINPREFAKAPAVILALLTLKPERAPNADDSVCKATIDCEAAYDAGRKFLETWPVAVEGEKGDDHTILTARMLRDLNLSENACLEILYEDGGWNDCCNPPWIYDDLERKVRSAYKKPNEPMGNRQAYLMELFCGQIEGYACHPDATDSEGITEILREVKIEIAEAKRKAAQLEMERPQRKRDLMRSVSQSFYDIAELKAEIGITTPLVHGWLQEGFMNGILARRGGGKTTVLMDLCCAGQADDKWFGVLDITHGYTFIYIALEDQTGVVLAGEAWQAAHPDIPINPRRFKIFDYPLNVLAPNRDQILKEICDWIRANMDHEKVCFVIDTFQRAATASQMDDEKMVGAVIHIEEYARSFDRGLCIVAFQPPKSGTMTFLGAGQLENMCGVKIDLNYDESTGPDGTRELFVDRIKGKERGNSLKFKVKGQEIEGTDDFGNPNTGPVAIYQGSAGEAAKHTADIREDSQILAEDVFSLMGGGGEYSLDRVARECGGKDVGSYIWLPRSLNDSRRMQGRDGLKKRLKAMAGHVWPLHDGLWELEVIVPAGTALMEKASSGPGKGVKVVIRECPKVGPL